MIKGIGSDIIEIYRIKQAVVKNSNFIEKAFTDGEQQMFNQRKNNIQTIAANFAAKEAVVKALGTGFIGISLLEIEVLRDKKGKPIVSLKEKALKQKKDLNIDYIHLTISHTKEYALAIAVAEGD